MTGIELRTDNSKFSLQKIVDMVKEANLFASQGRPIILAQIENEYGNIMWGYGDAGKSYIKWCAQMAVAQNIGVPWIMCQQQDAPQPMMNTCNGYYCDNFQPNNPKSPKMFTENWIGWFQKWGERVPYSSAEDSAFSVACLFQNGGVLNNYYMYHGGTNFGRTAGGPYITTSYDYDAPLDEYGNLNQPKWGHLKQLHAVIKLGEKILTNGTRSDKDLGNAVTLTTYTGDSGARFCFLSNTNSNADASVDLKHDGKYSVPAWSVTILDGCNKEVFNTAKVNSQTSGSLDANQLLEQKELTFDASDYLWYMTNVDINDTSIWSNATLRVDTMGHTLHAYVNRSKPMTWYKADFEALYGTNPVVVDLQGLGKGHAWVNRHSIGRYWPSWITASNGCSDTCDYRGKYDKNTLVLFEEIGENPQNDSFQTVTTGTVCAHVYEGALLELSCQGGQVISQIQFASFGNPKGKCGSFAQGSWEAIDSRSMVEAACIGRSSCGFVVTKESFSVAGANNGPARLAVQATC
ncbi:hypothetical protein Fmac_018653 [Flemingia macrophylla]|uniref:beta-galactosidase n=1 Tax=Flemingia macrophylla TaxID=520843 RepID=A0ABD1M5M0_9FABA